VSVNILTRLMTQSIVLSLNISTSLLKREALLVCSYYVGHNPLSKAGEGLYLIYIVFREMVLLISSGGDWLSLY
jgi:hypothetical protein